MDVKINEGKFVYRDIFLLKLLIIYLFLVYSLQYRVSRETNEMPCLSSDKNTFTSNDNNLLPCGSILRQLKAVKKVGKP